MNWHATYEEAYEAARTLANEFQLPVTLKKASKYWVAGGGGFVVHLTHEIDSDRYFHQIVNPGEPRSSKRV